MFITLILTFPTDNPSLRMRLWRTLKAAGAGTLRDGVYILPDIPACRQVLTDIAADIEGVSGGAAYLIPVDGEAYAFASLFDRAEEYGTILQDIGAAMTDLSADTARTVLKTTRRLRKAFETVSAIDFFPGSAKDRTEAAILDLERKVARASSPDEPEAVAQPLPRLNSADYQARLWATRQRPWVDRMASAWLILRFVDTAASFLWLRSPADAPPDALGFDYDGAAFTHVDDRVTFEVIAASFGLENEPLQRLGAIVHFLDVGGTQPAEAPGLESILKGMRAAITDDDALIQATSAVFDSLYLSFGGK